MTEDRMRWIIQIKQLREEHGFSIYEAERMAFGSEEWWRWTERRINSDKQCRKMALFHIKHHGEKSLIVEEAGRLKVKKPD
ncbi:hypothetical protein AAFN47_13170 [Hoeflea sp. CAU 1731]